MPVTLDLLRWGGERLRVGPWHGDHQVAYVAPLPDSPPPTVEAVQRCREVLVGRGFERAVTSALGPAEARGFVLAGFAVREHLHLLVHDLLDVPSAPTIEMRRGRRADRAGALKVDQRAFDDFWQLDLDGFEEALRATPSSRFRVVTDETQAIIAYAICGRAAHRGFVQRLGVDPDHHGRGVGRALVIDGLVWMRRRGVGRAVVNTQEHNHHALALYEGVGFRRQPGGLAVLEADL